MDLKLNLLRLYESVFPPKGSVHANPSEYFREFLGFAKRTNACFEEIRILHSMGEREDAVELLREIRFSPRGISTKIQEMGAPSRYAKLIDGYIEATYDEFIELELELQPSRGVA